MNRYITTVFVHNPIFGIYLMSLKITLVASIFNWRQEARMLPMCIVQVAKQTFVTCRVVDEPMFLCKIADKNCPYPPSSIYSTRPINTWTQYNPL